MKILHVTYDLRDRYNRKVTPAVFKLINKSKSTFESFTVDLVRVPNPLHESIQMKSADHLMMNIWGLPYGLLLNHSQNRAYNLICKADSDQKINLKSFDIIHTHKLTYEGLIGYRLSLKYDIPLVVTLRQTDKIVLTRKPGAIATFKPIIERCDKLFYMIPQILISLKNLCGERFFEKHIAPKVVLLPNIVERKKNLDANNEVQKGHFVTVLRMNKKIVKRKNIKRLLMAFSMVKDENITLKIIGDGDFKYKLEKWVKKFNLGNKVKFIGNVENDKIDKFYTCSEGFLLPSLSESFGLVYAEALLNGTPIMYSKNYLGFDGFFDGVGVGVDPLSADSIKNGILNLYRHGDIYRQNIKKLNESGAFMIFSSEYVGKKYNETINNVC